MVIPPTGLPVLYSANMNQRDTSLAACLTVWGSSHVCRKWVLKGLSAWSGMLDLIIIPLPLPAGRQFCDSPSKLIKFRLTLIPAPPLQRQACKDGALLGCHCWNLLAHHPRGQYGQHIHRPSRICQELPLTFKRLHKFCTKTQNSTLDAVEEGIIQYLRRKCQKSQNIFAVLVIFLLVLRKEESNILGSKDFKYYHHFGVLGISSTNSSISNVSWRSFFCLDSVCHSLYLLSFLKASSHLLLSAPEALCSDGVLC